MVLKHENKLKITKVLRFSESFFFYLENKKKEIFALIIDHGGRKKFS